MTSQDAFLVFGPDSISHAQFASRVQERARQLQPWQGRTVGLWADNDPDFVVNLFAIWRVGALPLLVSRRLPWETVASLLEGAEAAVVMAANPDECGAGGAPVFSSICRNGAFATERSGDLDELEIGSEGQELALILHTTGTTRVPGLVRVTRAGLIASLDLLSAHWDSHWTAGDASLGILPLFHIFGLCAELLMCFRMRSSYHFCAPDPVEIISALKRQAGAITRLFTVPWMLQQLLSLPGGPQALRSLRHVVVGGAALGEALGEQLASSGVRVIQGYGMTELGTAFMGRAAGGDWRDMAPVLPEPYWHLDESTGELVVHADCPTLSGAPQRDFPTRDLFHRCADGGYRYVSRVDDILVHASGEKSNALVIEQMLLARLGALIEHAAVVGAGHLRLACILLWRRVPTAADHEALLQGITDINTELAAHSRLHADMLLLLAPAHADRLPLTGKKTVARRQAEVEFHAELARLHAGAPGACAGDTIESFFPRPQDLDPEVSLFDQGLDSLDATALGAHIAKLHPGRDVPLNLVYRYPTLQALKDHLQGLPAASRTPPVFPSYRASPIGPTRLDHVPPRRILLTGATGFIGRHLLEELLRRERVEHIHCPIRRDPGGLPSHPAVTWHEGYAFGDPRLGLPPAAYAGLREQVDTVVHAAWPVDFNATYDQLADGALASVRHLIDFAHHGDKSLHFLSSVATVMMHPTQSQVDEEWPLPDSTACLPIGYAQTKWEAEHLVIRSGLRYKIYRLSEICAHSSTGRWNARDHLPILLDAARTIGCVPVLPQPIDWVPVDIACRALVELMTARGGNIHHIANPHPTPAESLGGGMPCAPLPRWLELAQPHLASHPRLAALWSFLHDLASWSGRLTSLGTGATCRQSPSLAACAPLGNDYLERLVSGRWSA
jgi:acyl-coenzyme A synthetase/AMP-(fatty) acid ligase/nucleoside-diphosphate-sugar epimerase/aryl carrier-like protein